MRGELTQKIKYRIPVILLLALSLMSGCQLWDQVKPESNYINDPVVDFDFHKDLVFGSNEKVKLDLYTPVSLNGNPAEVVILLHGGGWISGDKSFLKPTVDMLLKQGKNLAIVNMNYRVDSRAGDLLSLQLADLQNVINFLNENAEKYNLRKDNYRIVGFSAGGHIALTYAYRTTETAIKTVVAISAPTELTHERVVGQKLVG